MHGVPHFQVAEIALGQPGVQKFDSVVRKYHRDLDLSTAVQHTTFEQNGVKFSREAFASFPARVIVERFTADQPGAISAMWP